MAKKTEIEWTHHTFNPWWGCTKISRACARCYAALVSERWKRGKWGKKGVRWFPSEGYWRGPLGWNRAARQSAKRHRVFCASMGDVFEDRDDLNAQRKRLWLLIEATPHLDWQLLTKRPENVMKMVPEAWLEKWPSNVWIGTTTENQECADERLQYLLRIPAVVRFVSCEPLVGPLNLAPYLGEGPGKVNWVIAGGESGNGSEPSEPAWFRDLRDQCIEAKAPFFFKQWGNWVPDSESTASKKRHLPVLGQPMKRFQSKKIAGRELDGRKWDQFPVVRLPTGWPPKEPSKAREANRRAA